MSEELSRPGLIHKRPGYSDEAFMQDIDATGGWPVGYQFVSFYHAASYDGRVCIFGNQELRTPWWTTVLSSDDYYWWKISKEGKQQCYKEARQQVIRFLQAQP